jgi:sugar phosphate isomerase/epimerase
MKLGFVSAILADYSFEAMIDTAASLGFSCVEVACWPQGKAERRYAGVSHIDVENLTEERAQEILRYVEARNITISSLAYYPNPMDGNLEAREATLRHLRKVIDASKLLGVNLVTTFIGRDQQKTVEENLDLLETLWPPILSHAEEKGVRIAIENCPMLFGPDQ